MVIHVQIRLASDGFPNEDWLAARYTLEDWIIERKLGEILDAGAGEGVLDVVVRVDDVEKSKAEIEAILKDLEINDISTVRVTDDS